MIDRVAAKLGRTLYEVPVGFKWFVDGLLDGSLGFGGEESAGASFLRRDGTVVDDRQGRHHPGLARRGDHGAHGPRSRRALSRADARVRRAGLRAHRRAGHARAEGACWRSSRPSRSRSTELAGETIQSTLTRAPGNDAPIGGLKVIAAERLVRRASVGHRGHLQDLRRELPGPRPPAPHPAGSAGARRHRTSGRTRDADIPPLSTAPDCATREAPRLRRGTERG